MLVRLFNSHVCKRSMSTALKQGESLETLVNRELTYGAHNYKPAPIALARGEGIFLYTLATGLKIIPSSA